MKEPTKKVEMAVSGDPEVVMFKIFPLGFFKNQKVGPQVAHTHPEIPENCFIYILKCGTYVHLVSDSVLPVNDLI